MKKDVHPPMRKVLFKDTGTGECYIALSTLDPQETEVYEGTEYPVCTVSISSSSHAFFTGSGKAVDSEGRIQRFQNRYQRKK